MASISPPDAFLIARSMLSLGMDSALALFTARRRRGFMAGSGIPDLAATVISRERRLNSLDRTASARPLRCMMFLNFEWPAMEVSWLPHRSRRGRLLLEGGLCAWRRHLAEGAPAVTTPEP
jgi:hypothetical protein